MSTGDEWREVWAAACKLASEFPDVIFIGGVAVFVHLSNLQADERLLEFSHDVDAYVSMRDYADLRDVYVATPNRRLNKSQIEIGAAEIDLYVQYSHGLAVPYEDMQAHAVCYEPPLRVACLEHLLILKLNAAMDRAASPKGAKDRRDVAKIGYALARKGLEWACLSPYLNPEHIALLRVVAASTAFTEIARGNAFVAKEIRAGYQEALSRILSMAGVSNTQASRRGVPPG